MIGQFSDFIEIAGEEFPIVVHYDGYYEAARGMSGPWEDSSPAEGDMEITKIEFAGDWPEGLSKPEFDAACEDAADRLEEAAWDDYHASKDVDGYC